MRPKAAPFARCLTILGILFFAPACPSPTAPGCELETSYGTAVERWTAQTRISDPIEVRARFAATVESRIFREQRVRELGTLLGWGSQMLDDHLQTELKTADADTSFVVGAFTDRPRDNNLGDSRSIWRVALETQSGELVPLKIEALGRPDENQRKLYPYLDLFSRQYRIHFARVDGPVTLRIASSLGIADMKFERL